MRYRLNNHIKVVHTEGSKSHKCKQCGKVRIKVMFKSGTIRHYYIYDSTIRDSSDLVTWRIMNVPIQATNLFSAHTVLRYPYITLIPLLQINFMN